MRFVRKSEQHIGTAPSDGTISALLEGQVKAIRADIETFSLHGFDEVRLQARRPFSFV